MKIIYVIALFIVLAPYTALANKPCTELEYKQFDFWLGSWHVKAKNSKSSNKSQSQISRILNGCVILEEYSTPNGFEGKSLNIFDKSTNTWHQTWTDNTGLLLQLDGKWNGKSMILAGKGKTQTGEMALHKISWTPEKSGQVRQVWQQSLDNGKSWQPLFDGIYTKHTEHSF